MQYLIQSENPESGYFSIQLSFKAKGSNVILQMPSWRPGRYEEANYAKNIRSLRCKEGNTIQKTKLNQWVMQTKPGKEYTIEYAYYARKMDAGNSYLDENFWYINFINLLIFIHGNSAKCTIQLDFPSSFQVGCSLDIRAGESIETTLNAIFDAPLIAARELNTISYTVESTKFNIVVYGNWIPNSHKLIEDFSAFSKAQLELFGAFPFKEYTFIILSLDYPFYHGVEHDNATVITLGPASEINTTRYDALMGVASHELFHTWNVCQIKPQEFKQTLFTEPVITSAGFVMEGFTTYYGDLMLARSGFFNLSEFYNELNTLFARHLINPGRHHTSLRTASEDLWLDGYQKHAPSRTVSIYIKGALCAFLLDLKIRLSTDHQKSLDDVMRALWAEEQKDAMGYSIESVFNTINQITGIRLDGFLEHLYLKTTPLEELAIPVLTEFGIRHQITNNASRFISETGILLERKEDAIYVTEVEKSSPMYSHLRSGDKILAINNVQENWEETFSETTTAISIKSWRLGKERTIVCPFNNSKFYQKLVLVPEKEQPEALRRWV